MAETAKRALVAAIVFVAVIAAALALWKLKLLLAMLFLGVVMAAAMRPGVDWLAERRIPRLAGILLHYLGLIAVVGLLLWVAVPRALDQVQKALGVSELPTTPEDLERAKDRSTGIKHEVLVWLQDRLDDVPSASEAFAIGSLAIGVVLGIFFTLAVAAFWIYERDRAVDTFSSLAERPKRKTIRDTWQLIDLKLGAFVRGQALLMLIVGVTCTAGFWAIGLPYWMLVGALAGLLEVVPMIGPLVTGAVAIAVGYTDDWHTALWAALVVVLVQLAENYVIVPRVLGGAVGLSPLIVLVAVTAVGILFGGFAVLLAVPMAAVLATLVDVLVFEKDPAEEEVPAVLFPAKEAESGSG